MSWQAASRVQRINLNVASAGRAKNANLSQVDLVDADTLAVLVKRRQLAAKAKGGTHRPLEPLGRVSQARCLGLYNGSALRRGLIKK